MRVNPKEIRAALKAENTVLSKAALKYIEKLEVGVQMDTIAYQDLLRENLALEERIEMMRYGRYESRM